MTISYNWLNQFIDLKDHSTAQIGALLTQCGLEVESINTYETLKGGLSGIVIGEVMSCEKHPNADKLSKTTVNIGTSIVPIVCGAPNVAQGQKVVVATLGAVLYPLEGDSFQIKKAKIRGEESEGMICAEDEIGLGNSHAGIMVLSTDLPNGTPAADYFKIETDYIFEIGLTPNRADAASHLGVARDLSVLLGRKICQKSVDNLKIDNKNASKDASKNISVTVENLLACPRYVGVTVTGLRVQESPEWLKNRLKSIGLTPINNIVDVTNYVLHDLGQPLHAFDADKIKGKKILVKNLPQNTLFQTLDKQERKLSENDLIICDAESAPMCIAGVFGGFQSGVSAQTTSIFLESAYFSADSTRKSSQFHGLKTDASFRFERGTDPNMPLYALKRAVLLLQEIAGNSVGDAEKNNITVSEIIDIYPNKIANFEIEVSYKNIARLIGKTIEKSTIKNILEGLEMVLSGETENGFHVSVPPYRVDVQREADIIEEILRIYGFNNIEVAQNLSSSFVASFPKIDKHRLQNKVAEVLVSNGMSEIITNSLTKPMYAKTLKDIDENQNVVILNKLSEELEVLRQSLIFSGLEILSYNINRKQKDIKIFEFGNIYKKKVQNTSSENEIQNADTTNAKGAKAYLQEMKLALFFAGNKTGETWLNTPQSASQKVDFHYVAGFVNKVLTTLNVKKFDTAEADATTFAYGLNYTIKKKVIAKIGLLQDYITKAADLKQPVFYAEIDWDYLANAYKNDVVYQEIPKFPEVKRDLSLILDKTVTFDEIYKKSFQLEKKLLQKINVFSVYEGENIGADKKSYAISFFLQADETLTDNVIDKTMKRLIESFRKDFGAIIRE